MFAIGIDHEASAMLQSGEHVPDVGLITAAGEHVRLSDYYGHHLVVQCLRYYG
jgi:peroxiredoxin